MLQFRDWLRYLGTMPSIRRRWVTLSLLTLCGRAGDAQSSVSGVVRDSIAGTPLKGAFVQLVHADSVGGRTMVSDSTGRFSFPGVTPGRYRIGFIHQMLDSLGLEPIVHDVQVVGEMPVRADLAIPSAATLRNAMCRSRTPGKAVITGFVRDARDDSPIAGAEVAADWLEMTFQKGGVMRVIPRADAVSAANGWFALCNVPSDGIMSLFAAHGADTTDALDVHVSADGFLRHDLYLGGGRTGRISGSVVSAVSGERVASAQVSVAGRAPVRADAQGEWTLGDLPLGTRLMDVKAVGYYPERRAVNVTANTAPVRIGLSSLRAVLDTVRIRAARLQDRHESGFESRRRSGNGLYVTAEEIARKNAHSITDIFQGLRGLRIGFASDTLLSDRMALVDPDSLKTIHRQVLMRGIAGDLCAPSIFLNGLAIERLDADDLDTWTTPKEIAAIEVYSEATVPAQFQRIGKGCGSIVIWTKR